MGPTLDLVAGRALPTVALANELQGEMPPVGFVAACASNVQDVPVIFDATTGDILIRGHVAFRLDMITGELTGIPDLGVLDDCQNHARCNVQLTRFGSDLWKGYMGVL